METPFNRLITHINDSFPSVKTAERDGFLTRTTSDFLHPAKMLEAYSQGIFPWYTDALDFINWYAPDPRMVLRPDEVVISHSMKTLMHKNNLRVTYNQAYEDVLLACATTKRKEDNGTWLDAYFFRASVNLHHLGFSESVEVWDENDDLVGGLYATKLGRVRFGESMFSKKSNMSKLALIKWCQKLIDENVIMIDCQMPSPHLHSMGAKNIPLSDLIKAIHTS